MADLNCHRRLLAVSQATRSFHLAGGIAAEKTHRCTTASTSKSSGPDRRRATFTGNSDFPRKAQLVGTIGQIGLRKGQDVLLGATAQIAGQSPNAHYLIIGERNSEKGESRQFERDFAARRRDRWPDGSTSSGVGGDVGRLLGELTLLRIPPGRSRWGGYCWRRRPAA